MALPKAALLVLALVALASPVVAHGYQEASTPPANGRLLAAPSEIVIRMTEPIDVGETTVRVLDANGTNLATGGPRGVEGRESAVVQQAVAIPGNGTYTVTWKALWVSDGHITDGAFAFVVGNATVPVLPLAGGGAEWPGAAESAFRSLSFAAWLVAGGALMFPGLVSEPAWSGHPSAVEANARVRRRSAIIGVTAGALALLAAAGALFEQSLRTQHGWNVASLALATSVGKVLATRVAIAGGLLVAAALALRRGRGHEAGAGVTLAGLATLTFASHARAAQESVPFAMVPDYVHLLAASMWVGTIVALVASLPLVRRFTEPNHRARVLGPLVSRVSLVATLGVVALVATGTFAGVVHVGSFERLVSTLYGRVLLAKLAIVAVLLSLGLLNRQFFTPSFRKAGADVEAGPWSLGKFRRVVATEITLMMLVVAATGALAGISPQEIAVASPTAVSYEATGREFAATLHVNPADVGINEVVVLVTDTAGTPLADATKLTLALVYLDADDIPIAETPLLQTSAGRFDGNVTIGLTGEFLFQARLQRSTAYDDTADFFVTVPAAGREA